LKKVRILIDGKEVDISNQQRLRLALTYTITDIQNIDVRNSGFSKTITLPGTKRNDILFGFAFDVNSGNPLTQNTRPNALIEVEGTTIMEGFARITRSKIKNSQNTHEYEFRIIGDNGNWKKQIDERNVNELDFSEFDHPWNKANIDDSEITDGSGGLLSTEEIVYPLINYGMELDAPHPEVGSDDKHGVRIEDRYPAVQIKAIIEAIFKEAQFKVTSNFFDSDFFRRLYLQPQHQ